MNNIIMKKETPMGTIVVQDAGDVGYPGVALSFIPIGSTYERSVALLECNRNEDNPDGNVRLVVWGNEGFYEVEDFTNIYSIVNNKTGIFNIKHGDLYIDNSLLLEDVGEAITSEKIEYLNTDASLDEIKEFLAENVQDCIVGNIDEVFEALYLTEDNCTNCDSFVSLIPKDKKEQELFKENDVHKIVKGDEVIYVSIL